VTELSVEVTEAAGVARLILRGELDTDSVATANRALEGVFGGGFNRVILDLSDLDFMDSTGVKFLLDARESARELGVTIALAYVEGTVERVLTVSGVTTLFERSVEPEGRNGN
jgi:anti-anti-sigma factor